MHNHRRGSLWQKTMYCVVFLVYVAMLCSVIPFHEPWGDEAESWIVSRNFGLYSMLFRVLRYEGHPALWYAILWGPAHLHMSYSLLNWLSGSIAACGIYVLLRHSPFPAYLKIVLPFTFFLGYQYSVIARGYVLFPLLGFLIAHVYRSVEKRPILMAFLLGLLANVSVHGTLVAVGVAIAYSLELHQTASNQNLVLKKRELGIAVGVFTSSLLFVAICLWPASDSTAPHTKFLWIYHHLAISATSILPAASPVSVSSENLPPRVLAADATPPVSAPAPSPRTSQGHVQRSLSIISYSFATSMWLALSYQILFFVYLYRRNRITLIWPMVFLELFLVGFYSAIWHNGLIWVVFLIVFWIAWDDKVSLRAWNLQNFLAGFLTVLCVLQFSWTYHAVVNDRRNAYTPAKDLALFLKDAPANSRIAGFDESFAALPYFSNNIFFNLPPYAGFFKAHPEELSYEQVLLSHPDFVAIDPANGEIAIFMANGYDQKKMFCGHAYFPNVTDSASCIAVLVPHDSSLQRAEPGHILSDSSHPR